MGGLTPIGLGVYLTAGVYLTVGRVALVGGLGVDPPLALQVKLLSHLSQSGLYGLLPRFQVVESAFHTFLSPQANPHGCKLINDNALIFQIKFYIKILYNYYTEPMPHLLCYLGDLQVLVAISIWVYTT